jgi:hypothetical protein
MANSSPLPKTPLILALLCGLAAFSTSLRGPFIFDDIDAIATNPSFQPGASHFYASPPTTLSGRPVLWLTFAIDNALGDLHVGIYHITNLLIHLTGGAVLYAIITRTVLKMGNQFEDSAHWLAAAVTAIWLVHPLNTEAVTYTIQRAESLAGLFYLLVIYCVLRNWNFAAIVACALGMGTKETMVTAPIMAILYDRTFLSGSVASAWKSRRTMYIGLAATWAIVLIAALSGARKMSVGNVTPIDYAMTQLGVIWHYLLLTFWPHSLVLDYYDWPITVRLSDITPGGIIVLLLILLTLMTLWLKPRLGFLGVWFFLILAPSSSVIPIFTEVAAEHRMYLPLIAPIVLVVIGGWTLVSRRPASAWAGALAFTIALALLSARTFVRNAQYQAPEILWRDNIAQRPSNPRAHFNLGFTLMSENRPTEAAIEFQKALALEPHYSAAMHWLFLIDSRQAK